ncbi:MAG: hypothetical protein C0524_17730 [Rhodobacter sp.]|nr:hypothetical protein [Rhodobacter sp.]
MATYSLGFHWFGQMTFGRPAGMQGADASKRFGTPGKRFQLANAARGRAEILFEEAEGAAHPAAARSGPGGVARARIVAGSEFGRPGQHVGLTDRITVTTNEVPPREMDFHVLSIGGTQVGIIGAEPLDPGLQYTIRRATDPDAATRLHRFANAGRADRQMLPARATMFCLAEGTAIDTPDGARPIETLAPGDLVSTLANGSQPVRWVGSQHVPFAEMTGNEALWPVEFAAGAFGNRRPLLVSPRHRMLLNDWRAEVYFGEEQVLVPAQALVNGSTIRHLLPEGGVTYVHLLFDRHEVILSEGALSESFHPGEDWPEDAGPGVVDPVQYQEIEALFPGRALARRRAACPVVGQAEAQVLRLPE